MNNILPIFKRLFFSAMAPQPVQKMTRPTPKACLSSTQIQKAAVKRCLSAVFLFISCCTLVFSQKKASTVPTYDVIVVGGTTGGIGAALQSARLGARTLLCEETPWLGGMLSAAGVSAIDGNHRLPSGIWAEFREGLYRHYGGPQALQTGWVSNTQFEPHVANRILQEMAAKTPNLTVKYGYIFERVIKKGNEVVGVVFRTADKRLFTVHAAIVVDATDLGDVYANAGAAYRSGVDARAVTGEEFAPIEGSEYVQDLTWAAILKDYGKGADKTIPRPASYNAEKFRCSCQTGYPCKRKLHACDTMLLYARLPNGKYMINWPRSGNDWYANILDSTQAGRESVYQKARAHTLCFVYYIQHELGFKHLGLADDEYPTPDKLPFMPYHREGRRLNGLVTLNVYHLMKPFEHTLYRTGVAVGDYPLDHHHDEAPALPAEAFPPIPSFNVPLGILVPEKVDGLVIAEKASSITHLVNGSTRLQPCILLTGQAAGSLAATAALQKRPPRAVSVRTVQRHLLQAKAFLMPYLDVKPTEPSWAAIQRVGASGILRGTGVPFHWANQTWFYPDSVAQNTELLQGLQDWQPNFYAHVRLAPGALTIEGAVAMLQALLLKEPKAYTAVAATARKQPNYLASWVAKSWSSTLGLPNYQPNRPLTRRELAVLVDRVLSPFSRAVDWEGKWR